MLVFAYISLIGILIVFLIGITIYLVLLVYSWLKGAPYVPTKQACVHEIISNVSLKKGDYLLELGCGDGRMLRTANVEFGLVGKGVDINPLLVWFATMLSRIQNCKGITFARESIFETGFSQADIIYIFLFPELIAKLKKSILSDTKPGVIVISHGFKIPYLEQKRIHQIIKKPFSTYYYKT